MPSTITTGAKTKVFVGPTGTGAVLADYSGTGVTYQEIKEVSDLGALGDTTEIVEFLSLNDGRKKKLAGSKDAGTLEITAAYLRDDAGQTAMRAAANDNLSRKFKVQHPDGGILYFSAICTSAQIETGNADSVLMAKFMVAINTGFLDGPAA